MSFNRMSPLVSIIMPIYNTEKFLLFAIQSVQSQTYTNWELLLLNDQSPGDVNGIVTLFSDSRIIYFEHANSGSAATRNRGINECRGKYIAFLDSDDAWENDKLQKQIEFLEKNEKYGVIYSQRKVINEKGEIITGYRPKLFEGLILNRLWVDNFVCMSSTIIRRDVVDKVGFFDANLRVSQDYDYWLRVAAADIPFACINEPLVKYRIHEDQISNNIDTRQKNVLRIRQRFEEKYGHKLSLKARRIAKASILANHAYRNEGVVKINVTLMSYLKSLACYPFYSNSWCGVARVLTPKPLIQMYRKIKYCILKSN